ncbi:MAG: TRAP transporter small permease subunit [Pseudomonadota bacterium]|nr:TRAP transporter small permease subunit [Pseudomonadota bacterium]
MKIDAIIEISGRTVAWLSLGMVVITCTVVVLRYGFDTGAIALQESVTYMHALVFMIGLSYALKHDRHVRVDLLFNRLSIRSRQRINLIGHVGFLLPICVVITLESFDYVVRSWSILEGSPEAGGIPGVYFLKTLIPLSALLLSMQAISEVLRTYRQLRHD